MRTRMTRLTVNDAAREVAAGTTVAALLEAVTESTRGSAVVVDGEVLPRARWGDFQLHDGQTVELITAVQGG